MRAALLWCHPRQGTHPRRGSPLRLFAAQAKLRDPVSTWSPATLALWLDRAQLSKTPSGVAVSALLAGVSGDDLLHMSDRDLDERGVPYRIRNMLREQLLPAAEAAAESEPAVLSVDEQVVRASQHAAQMRASLNTRSGAARSGEAPEEEEEAGREDDAESELHVHLLPRPPTPPTDKTIGLVSGVAGALAATTAFIAAERAKKAQGLRTTVDTMDVTSPTLPYTWASQSAGFGMEWVKKALEVGEGAPLIGACFTLCLIIARSAEQALANKGACAQLGYLARRVALALAGADKDNMARVAQSAGQLKAALKEAAELVQQYASRGWLRRLAAAGGDAQAFKSLHNRVQEEMKLLSFDLQITAAAFKDETRALRALVLDRTGKTVDEGGLAELLAKEDGKQSVRALLGVDAQVLGAEITGLAAELSRVSRAVDSHLALSLHKELRGAVVLSVSLSQSSKKSAGGRTYLQQATLHEGFTRTQRRVAAFRVMAGHAVECLLSVDAKDNTDLRVKAIERVDHVEARYEPASRAAARRRCCGGSTFLEGLSVSSEAQLFTEEDVDISTASPTSAHITMALPDDAGPTGEVLTLKLRLWVSFHPAPALGEGFERGRSVPVTQTLFLAVYKRGSKRMLMRDIEDEAAKHRSAPLALGAPVLALPLLIHKNHIHATERMLKTQLVGWSDGTPWDLQ